MHLQETMRQWESERRFQDMLRLMQGSAYRGSGAGESTTAASAPAAGSTAAAATPTLEIGSNVPPVDDKTNQELKKLLEMGRRLGVTNKETPSLTAQ